MKQLNRNRMRFIIVGIVAAIVVSGGSAKADFTFGEPTPLEATINSGENICLECISADGLELYVSNPMNGNKGSMI